MSPTSCQTAPPRDSEANYSVTADFASNRCAPSQRFRLGGLGAPCEQALLGLRDDHVEHQCKPREHQDAGEYGVDIEHALGLQDQVADASGRSKVLADHRADECHADRSM